jgi:hypothetical protein
MLRNSRIFHGIATIGILGVVACGGPSLTSEENRAAGAAAAEKTAATASADTAPSFALQQWASQQGGFWVGQQWMSGDFNGDGFTDFVNVFNHGDGTADIDVHRATVFVPGAGRSASPSFVLEHWNLQHGAFDGQKWLAGDVDGDGLTDLIAVHDNGTGSAQIDVTLSTGSSSGGFAAPVTWTTPNGDFWSSQNWMVADVNGDGYADLVNVFDHGNGLADIDVHLSGGGVTNNGATFDMEHWALQQGSITSDTKWVTGDFDGDGLQDVASIFNDGGLADIYVYASNGTSSFTSSLWASQQGGYWDSQNWIAGDFDGDGHTDIANVFNDSGLPPTGLVDIDVHIAGAGAFTYSRWSTQQGNFVAGQVFAAGDFNGDKVTDVAQVSPDNGYADLSVNTARPSTTPSTLLIVTSSAFASTFSSFVTHKNAIGMPTTLLTVDAIRSAVNQQGALLYPGRDDAEQVKHAIETYHRTHGTKFVLLGGDSAQVPIRYRSIIDGGGQTRSFDIAELYYENLYSQHPGETGALSRTFDTWDSNGNGYFNEYYWDNPTDNPDGVEGFPDVAVGRIPAWNTIALQIVLNKIIAYENANPTFGGSGASVPPSNSYAFVADACYGGADFDVNGISKATGLPLNFPYYVEETDNCAYTTNPTISPGLTIDNTAWSDFTGTLNTSPGTEWVTYVGHGGESVWGYDGTFSSQIYDLTTGVNSIVMAAACDTALWSGSADFQPLSANISDYDTADGDSVAESCIASEWLTNPNGGAVAYIGENVVLEDQPGVNFIAYLIGTHLTGHAAIGDMWLRAKREYFSLNYPSAGYDIHFSEPRTYGLIITLLADPSLRTQ